MRTTKKNSRTDQPQAKRDKTMHHSLWLKTLRLQNIATFENQIISFDPHFNAIIGETGSGKSLIMDALSLVL
ncbi:MAG: AAA family ATPase, partial [Bacteriovoracaceae bacterium]|nr:AAA family ATPase [Bacteriovoracaceae bacterium]